MDIDPRHLRRVLIALYSGMHTSAEIYTFIHDDLRTPIPRDQVEAILAFLVSVQTIRSVSGVYLLTPLRHNLIP